MLTLAAITPPLLLTLTLRRRQRE